MTWRGGTPDAATLQSMAYAVRHRGPDGRGEHIAGNVGMVHRRLAIIDLKTGAQPLYGDGGTALIANAEIYNYLELRQTFGGPFKTASDCEPVLLAFDRYGLDFAEHLRGMYALALHDPVNRRLVLARDPFGIKPLYYLQTEAGFAFASEPQAFFAAGLLTPEIDIRGRAALLQLQYTTGRGTIYQGVERVLPGETVVVADGRIVERRRRAALPSAADVGTDGAGEDIDALDRVLADSVAIHRRSDVPYGIFLSGGIDSTALLAMIARQTARPPLALTVGFSGTGVSDERQFARAVARQCDADILETDFSETDFWALLPKVAAALDDPCADYATLPTYKLAALAKENGIKVVISGEGGDEMFAGYGRYRSVMRPFWRGGRQMRSRGIFDGLNALHAQLGDWRSDIAAAEGAARAQNLSKLQAAQAADCVDWLPNDLLLKLDRCLMSHGVEGRTPFLDPAVAAFALPLPDRLKVRKGVGKWLLRSWLSRELDGYAAFARKRGFTVPVSEWIQRAGGRLGGLVAEQAAMRELFEPGAVRALFTTRSKRAGHAAWVLLFYALWHRQHVLGEKATGGVFEVLDDARVAA